MTGNLDHYNLLVLRSLLNHFCVMVMTREHIMPRKIAVHKDEMRMPSNQSPYASTSVGDSFTSQQAEGDSKYAIGWAIMELEYRN